MSQSLEVTLKNIESYSELTPIDRHQLTKRDAKSSWWNRFWDWTLYKEPL